MFRRCRGHAPMKLAESRIAGWPPAAPRARSVPSPHSASKTRVNAPMQREGQGGGWPHMPHSAVSEHQRTHAKDLRRAMTRAETLLWRYIQAHRIEGVGFRRQVPMGRYMQAK